MKSNNTLWLVGAGKMSLEYFYVLKSLKQNFEVIGRGERSSKIFKKKTNYQVKTGGLKNNLKKFDAPSAAIVCVDVQYLKNITKELIISGTKRILLEKPGALSLKDISYLNGLAKSKKAKILVGYNRRFYSSVKMARDLIKKDNGALSMHFEFTENCNQIENSKFKKNVKEKWVISNSSHVIDLAFHLCGKPKEWNVWYDGKLKWHSSAARFCGSGFTNKNVMFTYLADWQTPGRWGVEIMTKKRKLILKPMESLKIMKTNSFDITTIKTSSKLDIKFKPGLYQQTRNFLEKKNQFFCTLRDQEENIKILSKIANY